MNAKMIAGWLAVALIIWLVIVNPSTAAHVVHNIGQFINTAVNSITQFFASI